MFLSVLSAALSGCQAQDFRSVEVAEFAAVIADTSVIRLDVRSLQEFTDGHIPGAAIIDVLQPDFEDKALARLPKDRTIALYCRSGRRSKKAAAILAQNGYTVVELNGGWLSWVNANQPIER